jgi:AcrR family transcriptional regulator
MEAMGRGEDTRKRIVERGLALASTLGLEGLTLGVLAEDLKLSKSGLFAHFDSKEAIQHAVIQEATEQFIQQVMAPALVQPRGEPRVRALFQHHLAWISSIKQPGGCIFMSAAVEFDDRPGAVREKILQNQRDWLDAIARAAQIAVKEKHFRVNLDTEQFAHEQQSIALGFRYAHRLLKDPKARHRAELAFESLLERSRTH